MTYRPLFDQWFYSYLNVENLNEIKQELINLHLSETNRWQTNQYYTNISSDVVTKKCPKTTDYLKKHKILYKFNRILFSSKQLTANAVHIDSYNPFFCQTSLNIPLIDCENSYTAFYKSNSELRKSFNDANYAWLPDSECEEIKRVEVVRPMLVNTTILHRGVTDTETRTICGIRFMPPLNIDDIRNLGINNPFTQDD